MAQNYELFFEEGRFVTNGPAKYELMTSLFSKGERITFTLDGKDQFNFVTLGAKAEDGSKEKWFLTGSVKLPNDQYFENKFELILFYDCRDRSGSIRSYNKIRS